LCSFAVAAAGQINNNNNNNKSSGKDVSVETGLSERKEIENAEGVSSFHHFLDWLD
jgi:hypothetical protein